MKSIANISYYSGTGGYFVIFIACEDSDYYKEIIDWCNEAFGSTRFYYKWAGIQYGFLHFSDDDYDIEGLYITLYEQANLDLFMLKWAV